jgi:NAD-dependent SIR2 family protein deacetylase
MATKKLLLANVYCGKCGESTTITNFSEVVRSGDLLLVGKCAECHDDVVRVIEMK